MGKIYPKEYEVKTEFSRIRAQIKTHCLSYAGKRKVDEMSFLDDYEKIENLLNLTSEFKHILQFKEGFPTSYFIDTKSYFEKVRNIGSFFSEKELFDIVRSLSTIKAIINFFSKDEENNYPTLKKMSAEVQVFPFVIERINAVISKYGEIKNNASPELLQIRNDLSRKQSSVTQTIHKILKTQINAGVVESDTEITVRDNKLLIPVDAKNKRKIKGIIYGESATGKTSYVEPVEVVVLNNEIKELEFAEMREIKKILSELTNDLRPYFDDLQESYNFMARIDFIRAKALFALETDALKPQLSRFPEVEFLSAKHPLLHLTYKNTDKKVIPSDIRLNRTKRILIISGPNAGGKSVCLKTAALLQYMLQCGLLIPVKEISKTGIFEHIFIDIGDEQSIENDLSTYSSHLKNMKYFTEHANDKTLFLIDEFGTGTEPMLGGAIAEAVLDKLLKTNARGVITTHYTNLKHFAGENEGIENAAMLYDTQNMRPLYQLETGRPGSSFAFEIAEKTGLSPEILRVAKSKIDKNQIDFEEALKQIQQEKRKLKQGKRHIRNTEIKLRERLETYENELENLLKNKKEILRTAKNEADEIISSANKKIEQTVLEIKRNNAEKEATKQLRKDLQAYITKEKEKQKQNDEQIEQKIKKLKRQKQKKKEHRNEEKAVKRVLQVGDNVIVKGTGTVAEILSIKKNKATLKANSIQLTAALDKLEFTDKKIKSGNNTAIRIIKSEREDDVNFMGQLDVRGKRAEDALFDVTRYIDNAIVKQIRHVSILHGTGNGILKKLIRDFLRTHSLVKSFKDERIEVGGAGITLVELDL